MGAPAIWGLIVLFSVDLEAQCPPEPVIENSSGGGRVVCPCFVRGERAGVVFTAPAEDYPIEILKVGIGWGSAGGNNPDSLEAAIQVYAAGLPNPGNPIASLEGPVLADGAINEYSLEILPGEIVIASGAFTVALEFLNDSTLLGPSVVHDGNGCRPGRNAVFGIPGGWKDACALNVTGYWILHVTYRRVNCEGSTGERFLRGDSNQSGKVNISDVIVSLTYLFLGGAAGCLDAVDANDDGELSISDPITAIVALFVDDVSIPPPFPGCGLDPGPVTLGCDAATANCP